MMLIPNAMASGYTCIVVVGEMQLAVTSHNVSTQHVEADTLH